LKYFSIFQVVATISLEKFSSKQIFFSTQSKISQFLFKIFIEIFVNFLSKSEIFSATSQSIKIFFDSHFFIEKF